MVQLSNRFLLRFVCNLSFEMQISKMRYNTSERKKGRCYYGFVRYYALYINFSSMNESNFYQRYALMLVLSHALILKIRLTGLKTVKDIRSTKSYSLSAPACFTHFLFNYDMFRNIDVSMLGALYSTLI